MGKFVRLCSNALHNTWFKGYSRNVEQIVPNKQYLQALKKVAKQHGQKPRRVRLCVIGVLRRLERRETLHGSFLIRILHVLPMKRLLSVPQFFTLLL